MRRVALVAAAAACAGLGVGLGLSAGTAGVRAATSTCAAPAWAAAAHGSAARRLGRGGTRYALWYARGAWNVAARGGRDATLAGRIVSDRAVRLSGSPRWLRHGRRSVSFRLRGTGRTLRAAFRSPCARRLAASFAGGATVLLGRRATAPVPSFALASPAVTGVEGRVVEGPTCPVVVAGQPCPRGDAQPAPGDVSIDTAPPSRADPTSRHVTTISTDAEGRFHADLPPGDYLLTPREGPRSRTSPVTVTSGVQSDITLVVATGIS